MSVILEKAYKHAESGDSKSALSIVMCEVEKLLALGLKDAAVEFARSIELDRIGEIAKHAHRLNQIRQGGA